MDNDTTPTPTPSLAEQSAARRTDGTPVGFTSAMYLDKVQTAVRALRDFADVLERNAVPRTSVIGDAPTLAWTRNITLIARRYDNLPPTVDIPGIIAAAAEVDAAANGLYS